MKNNLFILIALVGLNALSLQARVDLFPYLKGTVFDLTQCPQKAEVTNSDITEFFVSYAGKHRTHKIPKITEFRIDNGFTNTEFTGVFVAKIAQTCRSLTKIDLGSKFFPQGHLTTIFTNSPQLISAVGIAGTQVTDVLLETIGMSNNTLQELEITGTCHLTQKGLTSLFAGTQLRILSLGHCDRIHKGGETNDFSPVKNLHVFKMTDPQTCITDDDIISIAKQSPELQALVLNNCQKLHDASMEALATYCHDLKILELLDHSELTDSSLVSLTHGCPSIEVFRLSNNQNIGNAGFYGFCCQEKYIRDIEIRNCPNFNDACIAYLQCTACREGHLTRAVFDSLPNVSFPAFHNLLLEAKRNVPYPKEHPQSSTNCMWVISNCFETGNYLQYLQKFASNLWTISVNGTEVMLPTIMPESTVIDDYSSHTTNASDGIIAIEIQPPQVVGEQPPQGEQLTNL